MILTRRGQSCSATFATACARIRIEIGSSGGHSGRKESLWQKKLFDKTEGNWHKIFIVPDSFLLFPRFSTTHALTLASRDSYDENEVFRFSFVGSGQPSQFEVGSFILRLGRRQSRGRWSFQESFNTRCALLSTNQSVDISVLYGWWFSLCGVSINKVWKSVVRARRYIYTTERRTWTLTLALRTQP